MRRKEEVFGRAVGKSPEVLVSIHGHTVQVILDTGSEVTVLPETIYSELATGKPGLQDVSKWLKVYGANGVEVPYIGYTELDIDLLGVQLLGAGVLISQSPAQGSPQPTPLLGSNVLQELREMLREMHGKEYLQKVQETSGAMWTDAL